MLNQGWSRLEQRRLLLPSVGKLCLAHCAVLLRMHWTGWFRMCQCRGNDRRQRKEPAPYSSRERAATVRRLLCTPVRKASNTTKTAANHTKRTRPRLRVLHQGRLGKRSVRRDVAALLLCNSTSADNGSLSRITRMPHGLLSHQLAGDSGVDDRPSVAALQHNFNDDVRKAVLNSEFRDWPSLIRAPPNPAFALRTAARSLGSLPERHGLKGVLVWCPESWFGVARARCPTEGCSESLIHQGWYDAKLISDLDDSFYWWPRKLQCPSCRGRGLHCTYSAADAKILDQYDPFVKDQLERCITFVPPAEDATRNSFVGISRTTRSGRHVREYSCCSTNDYGNDG